MPARNTDKYAVTSWGEVTTDLEVPSGQLCLVRRPGIQGLVRAGILDSLDSLSGLVQTQHIDRVEHGKPSVDLDDMRALMADKEKLLDALDLMDKVLEYVVIKPHILRPVVRDENGDPIHDDEGREIQLPHSDRDPDQIYTDSVHEEDKAFIFQFVVGGVSDLKTFRAEFGEVVGDLAPEQGIRRAAKRAPARKR